MRRHVSEKPKTEFQKLKRQYSNILNDSQLSFNTSKNFTSSQIIDQKSRRAKLMREATNLWTSIDLQHTQILHIHEILNALRKDKKLCKMINWPKDQKNKLRFHKSIHHAAKSDPKKKMILLDEFLMWVMRVNQDQFLMPNLCDHYIGDLESDSQSSSEDEIGEFLLQNP